MGARATKWWGKGLFQPKDPADVGLTIKGAASQSGNLLEFQDSSGNVLGSISSAGALAASAGSVGTTELADAAVTSAKLDEQTIRYAAVSIAAAALGTLRATPVTLVAAPGAGKILEFVSAVLILDYTAPGFTETADNLAVKYVDGSGVAVSQAIECTGFIDQVADTVTNALPKIDAIATKAQCENVALVLHNTGDGEWGGGGGSALRVKVAYRVHTSGL